jgi:hypothetical protein
VSTDPRVEVAEEAVASVIYTHNLTGYGNNVRCTRGDWRDDGDCTFLEHWAHLMVAATIRALETPTTTTE